MLLSWSKYKKSVDIWSVGCILAEMLLRKPLFPGEDISHQLELIFNVIGTPPIEEIYQISQSGSREIVLKIGIKEPKDFNDLFPNASPLAIDLLSKMIIFDPSKRITVEKALEHPYLADFHLSEDEPESDEVTCFDFDFEDVDDITVEELKSYILDEIMLYHDSDRYNRYILDKKAFIENEKKFREERVKKEMESVKRKNVKL